MARNINQLHPWMQYKIYLLKKECKKQGLQLGIGECFRSVKEQEDLYAKGRSTPGKIVTNVRGKSFSSQHQWGIAVDIFQNIHETSVMIHEVNEAFELLHHASIVNH